MSTQGEDKNFQLITDPRIFGPGLWFSIHITAYHAKKEEEKKAFVRFMENTRDSIQCLSCKEHCIEYMEQNPITDYWNQTYQNEEIGMFKWTVNFHNAVNSRLNKPIIPWATAYNLYSKAIVSFCSKSCGSDDSTITPQYNTNMTFKNTPSDITPPSPPISTPTPPPAGPFSTTRAIATAYIIPTRR